MLLILITGFTESKAQIVLGKILADSTGRPVSATIVTHSGHRAASDAAGNFRIQVSGVGDTIKVVAIGYQTYILPVNDIAQNYIVIRLKIASVMLKQVIITAERNHQKDSIERRKEYSRVFNYQPVKVKDALVSPPSNVPFTFVSIDLLRLLNALNKRNDPNYRLKKVLLQNEEADYVATRFNRRLVTGTTGLKSDSLNLFMGKYYPAAEWVKKASDYDIVLYIKTKVAEFRRPD